MGTLTLTSFVTLDGVYQAPGGPKEDPRGGFKHGGWSVPYGDEDFGRFMVEVFERVDAFLLGRRTYNIFASLLAQGHRSRRPDRVQAEHPAEVRRLRRPPGARVGQHDRAERRPRQGGRRPQGAHRP